MNRINQLIQDNNIESLTYTRLQDDQVKESFLSEGLSNQTLFSACSVSKLLTVVAILIASEEGKLDIQADVNDYLKEWKLKGGSVSASELMTHQSGLTDAEGAFEPFSVTWGKPNLIDLLRGTSPYIKEEVVIDSEHRKAFIYSDNNTLVLEKVLEDLYRLKFREIITQKILEPLGMLDSHYIDYETFDTYHVAYGYDQFGNPIRKEQNIYPYDSVAGLWTTSGDLAKLLGELLLAYKGKSEKLLTRQTVKAMVSPQGIVDFAGYGVFVYTTRGMDVFYTQGWGMGFQSFLMGIPETGDGIIVMMNQNPGVEQMEGPIGHIVHQWLDERCG